MPGLFTGLRPEAQLRFFYFCSGMQAPGAEEHETDCPSLPWCMQLSARRPMGYASPPPTKIVTIDSAAGLKTGPRHAALLESLRAHCDDFSRSRAAWIMENVPRNPENHWEPPSHGLMACACHHCQGAGKAEFLTNRKLVGADRSDGFGWMPVQSHSHDSAPVHMSHSTRPSAKTSAAMHFSTCEYCVNFGESRESCPSLIAGFPCQDLSASFTAHARV